MKKKTGWNLFPLMAQHKMRTAAELSRRLAEYGIEMTSIYLSRMMNEKPARLNMELLDAFCNMFDCTPNDLLPLEDVPPEEPKQELPSNVVEFKKKEPEEKPAKPSGEDDVPKNIVGPILFPTDK